MHEYLSPTSWLNPTQNVKNNTPQTANQNFEHPDAPSKTLKSKLDIDRLELDRRLNLGDIDASPNLKNNVVPSPPRQEIRKSNRKLLDPRKLDDFDWKRYGKK